MNFQAQLAEKVMRGEKTVTRRLCRDNPRSPWFRNRCSLKVGRDYAVCPGRGKTAIGRVLILRTDKMRLGRLAPGEAWREGFASVAEFEEAFAAINGSYDRMALVWRVEFAAECAGHEYVLTSTMAVTS